MALFDDDLLPLAVEEEGIQISLLSVEEAQELETREARIDESAQQFRSVFAEEMEAILEDRLYVPYGTFNDYCRKRWNVTEQHARRVMGVRRIRRLLNSKLTEPVGSVSLLFVERHLRPLLPLEEEDQVKVGQEMLALVQTGTITAEKVQQIVDDLLARKYRDELEEEDIEEEPEAAACAYEITTTTTSKPSCLHFWSKETGGGWRCDCGVVFEFGVWHCPECNDHNPEDQDCCRSCGFAFVWYREAVAEEDVSETEEDEADETDETDEAAQWLADAEAAREAEKEFPTLEISGWDSPQVLRARAYLAATGNLAAPIAALIIGQPGWPSDRALVALETLAGMETERQAETVRLLQSGDSREKDRGMARIFRRRAPGDPRRLVLEEWQPEVRRLAAMFPSDPLSNRIQRLAGELQAVIEAIKKSEEECNHVTATT